MKKEEIVINTLVFVKSNQTGVSQEEMIKKIASVGFKRVEVRREFIKNIEEETAAIGRLSKEKNIEMFYSVPEKMYEKKKLRKKEVASYFYEAFVMNCHFIKFIVGEYEVITQEDIAFIKGLKDKYEIELTVENDQTKENGQVNKMLDFLKIWKEKGGEINTTFDVGNWLWIKENPFKNAMKLFEFVSYIHIKDVREGNPPSTRLLNEGDLPLKRILEVLPKNVPVALEYPMGEKPLEVLENESEKFLEYYK
ncbi:MAG: sugar phosphate isomerase/epimerase family protein [Breznakia sp.]